MTDNEKLSRWQGLVIHQEDLGRPRKSWGLCTCGYDGISHQELMDHLCDNKLPDYLNDDAAAMSLLDTLAEKGYKVQLVSSLLAEFVTWDCWITYAPKQTTQGSMDVQTRREAVVAAVLELIEKET